jgi:hypothetical protein
VAKTQAGRGRKRSRKEPRPSSASSVATHPPPLLDSQAIGDRAEDAFKYLCTEANIIANPPFRDRRGWDFILDCPFPNEAVTPDYVARPTQIMCRAQVKGSLNDSGTVPVSLANLERMSKERVPWFVQVVILMETAPHRPRAAYLVHVDERVITPAIKRLSESSLKNVSPADQTMDVSWSDADRIDLTGESLLAKIRSHVPDVASYPDIKGKWIEAARAEALRESGTISFYYRSDNALYTALADLAIGELEYIPLRSFRAKGDVLKKTSKSASVKTGRKTMHVEPFDLGETIIELQSKSGTTRLKCSTRAANAAFRSLPDRFNKLRFDSRFLKFVVGQTAATSLTWNIKLLNLTGKATLAELDAAARAMQILSSDGVAVTVTTPWGKQDRYNATEKTEYDQDSKAFVFVVTHLCAIAGVLNMALDSVDVDVAKLLTQWRRLLLLRSAVDESCKLDQFGIWLEESPTQSEAAVVLCPGVDLGATVLVGCGSLMGPIATTPEDGGYRVSIAAPSLRRFERGVYASDQWNEAIVMKMMDDAAAQLDKEGVPLIVTADPPITVRPPEPVASALQDPPQQPSESPPAE